MQKWEQAKQTRRQKVEAQIIDDEDNSHVKSETIISLPDTSQFKSSLSARPVFKAEIVGVTYVKAEPQSEVQITTEDLRKLQVQDIQSEESEEEVDDDDLIERRRAKARARAQAEAEEKTTKDLLEDLPFEGKVEEDAQEADDYESSEFETDEDDEQTFRPLLKPQFVSKKDRATLAQREAIEQEEIALEEAKKLRIKERKVLFLNDYS